MDLPLYSRLALEKRRWLTSLVAFLAGAALLIVYFQSGPNPITYFQAEEALSKWEAAPDNEPLFLEMKHALKKVPAFEKRYGARIAQRLLERGEKLEEVQRLVQGPLEGLKNQAPFHAAFGEISLLIEQGAIQEALERSVHLKEQLTGAPLIYGETLLRIAFLQKELQNGPGERAAWEEFEAFLQEEPIASSILASFKGKGVDLPAYILERKKDISRALRH